MERKETQQPRIDRKTLVLTVVAALLVIAIIIIAVVLLQRSRAEEYNSSYEAAMEHYIAGEYQEALDAARRAYGEDATEEAVLIIAAQLRGPRRLRRRGERAGGLGGQKRLRRGGRRPA